jgi:hypothetical protein
MREVACVGQANPDVRTIYLSKIIVLVSFILQIIVSVLVITINLICDNADSLYFKEI